MPKFKIFGPRVYALYLAKTWASKIGIDFKTVTKRYENVKAIMGAKKSIQQSLLTRNGGFPLR